MAKQSLDNTGMLKASDDFEIAYKAHARPIYQFLYWRTKNVGVSQDLTSSVFEKAWRSRSSFHGGSSQAWLYRIARNALVDHWRKKKELPLNDADRIEDISAPNSGEAIDKELQAHQLQKALNRLPRNMRSVLTLRFIEGLSSKQVAKQLHLSESNVRVIQYRGLQKLRGYLK